MKKISVMSEKGSSSVLVIMILICLSVFGVLSMMSAKSDFGMALRRAEQVREYYALDSQGVNLLAELKGSINKAEAVSDVPVRLDVYAECLKELGFEALIKRETIKARITLKSGEDDRAQKLDIELEINASGDIGVVSWRNWNDAFEYSEDIQVWQG